MRRFKVGTHFEASDVLELAYYGEWTTEKAEEFLRKHEQEIREAMVMAGHAAIEDLLTPTQTALTFD